MIRIRKYIPDFITSLNLLCGVAGVVFATSGHPEIAFPLMLLGAVFDFLDGFAARLLDSYSPLGKELDSLADLVTFGVLPSMMLYHTMYIVPKGESLVVWVPLLIAVFSGLRLAKFNVDERQHHSFIGLPTPACAMICGSLCYFVAKEPSSALSSLVSGWVFVPVLSVVLSFLLVCEIPMFSMKFSGEDGRDVRMKRNAFFISAAVCVLFVAVAGVNWSLAVTLVFTVYVLLNIVLAVFRI